MPKELEHMLPPTDKVAEEDYDSASDTSWDEASAIDGHGWWETGSDEVIGFCRKVEYNERNLKRREPCTV